MPVGEPEYYTFRGEDKLFEDSLSVGRGNNYNTRSIRRFHIEQPSSSNQTFMVKYAITPTAGGVADFWYHYTFTNDIPIEGVLSTLNSSTQIFNDDSGEFDFTFDSPSWTNKLKAEVNHIGQTITFKATRGLAYKLGLIPDKEYTVSDTDGNIVIGDYNTQTIASDYYDLYVNNLHIARTFADTNFRHSIIYNVYTPNRSRVDTFRVMDSNRRQLDIAYSVEIGYITQNDVNFRLPRFNVSGENNHIYTTGYEEAGVRELVVFDKDHYISANDTALTYFGYNVFTKANFGNAYLTDSFELSTNIGDAMTDIALGANQVNVTGYIVIGADVNGREHTNLTVLPVDSLNNIIPVDTTKTVRNPLVNEVRNPTIEIDGTQSNIPGITPLIEIAATELNAGYTNGEIFQKLLDDTPISYVNQGTSSTIMSNEDSTQIWFLLGSQAVGHYLSLFDAFATRFQFYESFINTDSFTVLDHEYTFEQVNVNDCQPLFYTMEYEGQKRYVNEISELQGILWMKNVPDYYQVKCYARDCKGAVLYEVETFSFELLLR